MISLPFPSQWGIHATAGGRPVVYGTFTINAVSGNRVAGTVQFRDIPIPISGYWDENRKVITMESPYAIYVGQLYHSDDPSIGVRHFTLSGSLRMKPPSVQAGEFGTWIATTYMAYTGTPVISDALPPVGVFLTSNLLYGGASR